MSGPGGYDESTDSWDEADNDPPPPEKTGD